jgi:hypothetical protein
MNRYDFFKAKLLKTPYFVDSIYLHFTASFIAVGLRRIAFVSLFLLIFLFCVFEGYNCDYSMFSSRRSQKQDHERFWAWIKRTFNL